jgi:hypothetical protein
MNNGHGRITMKRAPDGTNTEVWSGTYVTQSGLYTVVQALAQRNVGYQIEIKAPKRNWERMAQFNMPPFGDRDYQDIDVPKLGRLRATRSSGKIEFNYVPM